MEPENHRVVEENSLPVWSMFRFVPLREPVRSDGVQRSNEKHMANCEGT